MAIKTINCPKRNEFEILKLANIEPFHVSEKFVSSLMFQAFINYNFSCTRFRVRKIVVRARPCTWEIVNEQTCTTCTLLTITWYDGRNCTKLVLKPLASKNDLSISVLCIASFLLIILFQVTWWLLSIFAVCIYLHSSATIFDKLKAVKQV